MSLERREDGEMVTVVYGSSQNVNQLRLGEAARLRQFPPIFHPLAQVGSL